MPDTATGKGVLAALARACTPQRARGYPRLMAGVALVLGVVNFAGGEGWLDRAGHVIGPDFLAFYTGAQLARAGRADAFYDFDTQLEIQQRALAPQSVDELNPFISPPHAALLYLPFGLGDYGVGLAAWWTVQGLALVLAAAWLARALPRLRKRGVAWTCLATLLFFPTWSWIFYGQATAWIGVIYAGTFVLLRQGRDFWAGLLLGCLAFKPQLALLAALVLVTKGRWAALAGGAVSAAGWVGLGALLWPEATRAYLALAPRLTELLRFEGYPTWGIHSWFGFAALLLDGVSRPAANALAALLAGATVVAALLWWRRTPWEPGARRWDLGWAATWALGLLVSPHLFVYDLTLLLVPAAILWQHEAGRSDRVLDGGRMLAWTALVWGVCFLGSYLTQAQLAVSGRLGLPLAVQLSTPVIVAAAWTLLRAAGGPQAAREDLRLS